MSNPIRRNRDGMPNITDLRRALAADPEVNLQRKGGEWIVSRYCEADRVWRETSLHHSTDERSALQTALGVDD